MKIKENQSIFSKSENTKKEKIMIEWMQETLQRVFCLHMKLKKQLINHRITESIEHKRTQKTKLGKNSPKTKAHIFNYLSQKRKRD
jgi:predicted membrane chloride channel (bestrophin family)